MGRTAVVWAVVKLLVLVVACHLPLHLPNGILLTIEIGIEVPIRLVGIVSGGLGERAVLVGR